MPVYKYKVYSEVIELGDTLYVEEGEVHGTQVKVLSIVKIDLSPSDRYVWFEGVPVVDLV